MKKVVITGGAGFVGSNLAVMLKTDNPELEIVCLDSLKRRGSELTLNRLREHNITFVHGDIRSPEDLKQLEGDVMIECSAEPSVLAGYENPKYIINTNLTGTINCLEWARKNNAAFIFLSTSRVYPTHLIGQLALEETETRFEIADNQQTRGVSSKGISEDFPIQGACSLYGATKLASEIMITEYIDAFNLKAVVNRCGVISGPWQMGKVDQGVVVLWIARHYFQKPLKYIGYGGTGKQVRDMLHIADLYDLVKLQLQNIDKFAGKTFNVGGGREVSVSLKELTTLCEKHTGKTITITSEPENRKQDVPIYLTDTSKIQAFCGWKPKRSTDDIVKDITEWITQHEQTLKPILS